MKKPIRVKSATFYQGVTLLGQVVNTIHVGMFTGKGIDRKPKLKGCEMWYMGGLIMIKTPDAEGNETDSYIGMANVRSMDLYKEDSLFFPVEESLVPGSEEDTDEDSERLLLAEAIKRAGGATPHPNTGLKKLKDKLAELEGGK